MASASEKIEKSDNISALTCAICLGFYEKPKVLPKCGHSYCAECLRKLVKTVAPPVHQNRYQAAVPERNSVTCPECRVESIFNKNEELKTNIAIQRMIDHLKQEEHEIIADNNNNNNRKPLSSSANKLGDSCSHYSLFASTKIVCKHCKKSFCQSCLVCHRERLKIEINWLSNSYEKRLSERIARLEAESGSISALIDEKVEKAEKNVAEFAENLLQKFVSAIETKKATLLGQVREMGEAEKAKLSSALGTAKSHLGQSEREIDQPVAKLNEKSPFSCSLDEVVELRQLLVERDQELSMLDDFKAVVSSSKMHFRDNNDLIAQVLGNFDKVASIVLEAPTPLNNNWIASDIQRLHGAAKSGDLDTVLSIFNRPKLPAECKVEMLEHLDAIDTGGQTALMQATTNGHTEIVRYLVTDQNVVLSHQEITTPIQHLAASMGHLEIVKFLIESNKCLTLTEAKDKNGDTALNHAALKGHLDVVRYLVEEASANIENCGAQGRTPLLCAIDSAKMPVLECLLSKNANVLAANANGNLAIHLACCKRQCEMVRRLLAFRPDLLERRNTQGNTPLHMSVLVSDVKTARFLVEEGGANVNIRNKIDCTPLDIAAEKGHVELVKYLFEKGTTANVDETGDNGNNNNDCNTALRRAIIFGRTEVVRYFLQVRPQLANNFKVKNGISVMALAEFATQTNQREIVALLEQQKTAATIKDGEANNCGDEKQQKEKEKAEITNTNTMKIINVDDGQSEPKRLKNGNSNSGPNNTLSA